MQQHAQVLRAEEALLPVRQLVEVVLRVRGTSIRPAAAARGLRAGTSWLSRTAAPRLCRRRCWARGAVRLSWHESREVPCQSSAGQSHLLCLCNRACGLQTNTMGMMRNCQLEPSPSQPAG